MVMTAWNLDTVNEEWMTSPVQRFLAWIVILPLAVILALFAIANRGDVVISIDPLPFTFALPLYLIVFGAAALGLVLGYLVMLVAGYRTRRDFRWTRRQLAQVKSELHAIHAENATPSERASVPSVGRNRATNDTAAVG